MRKEEMMLEELVRAYGMEHEGIIDFAEMVECGWSGEWMVDRYNEVIEKIESEEE